MTTSRNECPQNNLLATEGKWVKCVQGVPLSVMCSCTDSYWFRTVIVKEEHQGLHTILYS